MKGIKVEIYIEGMDELEDLLKEAKENVERLENSISKIKAARLRVNLKMQEATVKSDLEGERKVTPGIEIIKQPGMSAEELADILCKLCPPYVCDNPLDDPLIKCNGSDCQVCWLAWLATGRPPRKPGADEINLKTKEAKDYEEAIKNGKSTINQIRKECGLKPIDDENANILLKQRD